MITSSETQQLWALVEPLKTGMLTTLEHGNMHARPMHLVQKEFHGSFYFFTAFPTEKTQEIEGNPTVCLTFSCPKAQTFVSILGRASLVRDKTLMDAFWNPFVAAWFPEGKDSSSLTLLKVDADEAEYWQGKGSRLTQLFKYGKAYMTRKRPDIGEHGRL